jgi:hypothetical protein
LVYAIAAYTITIGTLAIYGVVIGHRQRLATAALVRAGAAEDETFDVKERAALDPTRGFNIGAALLAPFWMWAHGMRAPAALLLVLSLALPPLYQSGMWIVFFATAAIPVAAGAALGFAGNRIAVAHRSEKDSASLAASQLPWAIAGIFLHVIVAPWAYFLLAEGSIG